LFDEWAGTHLNRDIGQDSSVHRPAWPPLPLQLLDRARDRPPVRDKRPPHHRPLGWWEGYDSFIKCRSFAATHPRQRLAHSVKANIGNIRYVVSIVGRPKGNGIKTFADHV
jgi:hypothetical protein